MEIVNWKKGLDRMFSDTHKHNSAVHTRLATSFVSWSAYNYVLSNPVVFIDPSGRMAQVVGDGDGEGTVVKQGSDGTLIAPDLQNFEVRPERSFLEKIGDFFGSAWSGFSNLFSKGNRNENTFSQGTVFSASGSNTDQTLIKRHDFNNITEINSEDFDALSFALSKLGLPKGVLMDDKGRVSNPTKVERDVNANNARNTGNVSTPNGTSGVTNFNAELPDLDTLKINKFSDGATGYVIKKNGGHSHTFQVITNPGSNKTDTVSPNY